MASNERLIWICSIIFLVTIVTCQGLKPGQCPPQDRVSNNTCENQCSDDTGCSGEKICCFNGCGVADCMTPIDGLPQGRESRYEVLACEGEVVYMMCPHGSHIKILAAFWGRGNRHTCSRGFTDGLSSLCSMTNVTSKIRSVCEDNTKCIMPAMTTSLGEPCTEENTHKYLKAEYYCQESVTTLLTCQDSGLSSISCSNAQVIAVQTAFWGRGNNADICPHESATGMETCSQDNAFKIFKEMCDGRIRCEFMPSEQVFGDICPDVHKLLSLSYTCTECRNIHIHDDECELWNLQGECGGANSDWMTVNCRRTCERCSEWIPEDTNLHSNSTACDLWAQRGDCIYDAPFMLVYCRQSCTATTAPVDCNKNKHDDLINQRDCQRWADDGQCQKNNHYMFWDCTKACFGCHNDNSIRCENKHANETACEIWKAAGDCDSDPGWMIPNCYRTCIGCQQDPLCINYENDTSCEYWESIGECESNAVWMHQYCWKSCIGCTGAEDQLTDCSANGWDDFRDSDNCDARHQQGQCVANDTITDMFTNCTKSCFECDDNDNKITCVNKAWDDDCEDWAATGECDRNPGWMIPNCLKTCLRCDTDPVCTNDDPDCDYWASIGQCSSNPLWMHKNCWKSCMKCYGDLPCDNKASNYDCEYWMRFGWCEHNAEFMMDNCSAACTRCNPEVNGVPECRDLFPDSECTFWAENNKCAENPTWMVHYCRKSCTQCGTDVGTTSTSTSTSTSTTTTTVPDTTTTSATSSTTTTSATTSTVTPTSTTTTTVATTPSTEQTTTTTSTTSTPQTTTTTTTPHTTTSTTTTTPTITSTTTTPPTTTSTTTTPPTSTSTTTTPPTTTSTTTTPPTTTSTTTTPPTTTSTTTTPPTTTSTTTTPPTTTSTTTTPPTTTSTTTTTPPTTTTATTTTTSTAESTTTTTTDGIIGDTITFGANVTTHGIWKGETNHFTTRRSFLPPIYVPSDGILRYFTARIVANTPVELVVWRIATTSNSWSKFFNAEHSQVVRVDGSPDSPFNLKEAVNKCLEVKEGDIIGFSSIDGESDPAPIDFRRNSDIRDRTYFRTIGNDEASFYNMHYTFEFAVGGVLEEGGTC